MTESPLEANHIVQIGIIVRDIQKTSAMYASFLGVPFPNINRTEIREDKKMYFNGKESSATAQLAFFDIGSSIQLELIEPDSQPSTWRKFLDEKGEGFHHIAFEIKDMDGKIKRLEQVGINLEQRGGYEGGEYAYLDATHQLKLMIELLENK